MHPHGCYWAYVGIEVRDYDRSQVVPAYRSNPKLIFSKPYFKSNCFKTMLEGCFGFQNLRSNTLFYFFYKEIPKPNAFPK
jgi:hypothetical protein